MSMIQLKRTLTGEAINLLYQNMTNPLSWLGEGEVEISGIVFD